MKIAAPSKGEISRKYEDSIGQMSKSMLIFDWSPTDSHTHSVGRKALK